MTTLYFAPGACSFAAHVILKSLETNHGHKAAFEKVVLRQPDSTIFNVNPLGKVPTLKLNTGETLTENSSILPYLGDLVPEAKLSAPFGTVDRARIQEWIGFVNSEIHAAFKPVNRPEFYTEEKSAHDNIRAIGRENLTKLLKHVEKRLNNLTWVVGNRFTIADAYLGYWLRAIPRLGIDAEQFPNIKAYVERYSAHPDVVAATDAEKTN
jgi:glutathione S-transferase